VLILLSLSNYIIGIRISKTELKKLRKLWLIAGLVINLSALVFFKYFNFFIDSFVDLVSLFGYVLPSSSLKIVLPVGISFYVFLSLSYIIDIHKKTLSAERNIFNVLLSFSFFPIILAGPIQRPSTLLPQISKKREFNYQQAANGLRQILWGLFTKVVIADNLSLYVDDIFRNFSSYPGSTLLIGAIFYTIQIYADFSGYSNMAIGIGKLLGFNLMRNFAYPYFSRDITEFWKRWHMSLTTWFRDYLFLPISINVAGKIKNERVLFLRAELFIYIIAGLITWFLTGLWHGANYTYILWGLINGVSLIIYQWQKTPRKKLFKKLGISNNAKSIVIPESILTMGIIIISWIFFRSDNIKNAVAYLGILFSGSLFSMPVVTFSRMICLIIVFFTFLFFTVEWIGREGEYGISWIGDRWSLAARWTVYYLLALVIFFFAGTGQNFIYFQF